MSPLGPGWVKILAVFLCDGSVGLDDLSGCDLRFVDLFGSRGLVGRDLRFRGDSAGWGRK